MGRSHKIWVDAKGGSAKGFGCGNDDIRMDVNIGSSASNSRHFANIKIEQWEDGDTIHFRMLIDGQVYKRGSFNRKSKEFGEIDGRVIDGSTEAAEKREKENADSMMRSVGMVAAMGSIFGNTQKESNDWKARMLKAGLTGLQMPEDWDTLSEDEKEKRLDKVIAFASGEGGTSEG